MSLRYFDAPEFNQAKAKEDELKKSRGKLKQGGATMWLRGDGRARTRAEIDAYDAKHSFEASKRYMAKPEVHERTLEKEQRFGQQTHAQFNRNLPRGYAIPPVIEAKLLEEYPHLCVTQFTHVPLKTKENDVICALYVANFDAQIDMSPDQPVFLIKDPKYGRMYFCIAWRIDKDTNELSIARDIFSDGLAFRTGDMKIAFDHTVHITTGIRATDWRKKLEKASKSLKKVA